MSHGARNCPFLTLTTRPVAAAATSRSVCRHRNAGICKTSTTSATRAHCCASCTSVRIGDAELLADVGEDRQRAVEPDAAGALAAGAVGLVERGLVDEPDADLARRSLATRLPSPWHGRGFRARTAPRSAQAAAHCRSASCRRRRWDWARARPQYSCRRDHAPARFKGQPRRAHGRAFPPHRSRARRDRRRASPAPPEVSAIDRERWLRKASSGVAFGSSTTMSASRPGAKRADAVVERKRRGRRRGSRDRTPRWRRSGGFAAAPPCRPRPWSRAARSWCRRRCRCRDRRGPDGADRARRAGETTRCRGTGSRSDSAPAPFRTLVTAFEFRLVQMHAVGQHRAPADQAVMGVDVEIVAPLRIELLHPGDLVERSPRCGSARAPRDARARARPPCSSCSGVLDPAKRGVIA